MIILLYIKTGYSELKLPEQDLENFAKYKKEKIRKNCSYGI